MNKDLQQVFKQSSSISYVCGKRDSGKTAWAHRCAEDVQNLGVIKKLATNVGQTRETDRIEYICYYDDFKQWLKTEGNKLFILDELGQHLNRMRFMTEKSKLILDVCQLVRKFDAHLIGIAPSPQFVNRLFLNTDILDCYMRKLSRKKVKVFNYVTHKYGYIIYNIPNTTLPFLTKDIAMFDLKNPKRKGNLKELPLTEKAALLYAKHRSLRKVGKLLDLSHEEIRKLLNKHVQLKNYQLSTVN